MGYKEKFDDTNYTSEEVIKLLNKSICPYCEKRGFKSICTHITRVHGISSNELKDKLLIPRETSFLSDDYKTERKQIAIKINSAQYLNQFKGIEPGYKRSELSRKKQSKNRKYTVSDSTREKIISSFTKERRELISNRNRGEGFANSKLTEQQVIKIKELLQSRELTRKQIGELFGVTKACIQSIAEERTWKHIKLT